MRRVIAVIGLALTALTATAGTASARELIPRCILVPDGDGHVKEFCRG